MKLIASVILSLLSIVSYSQCDTVHNLTISSIGTQSAVVSANVDDNSTSYILYYWPASDTSQAKYVIGNTPSFTITGLTPNTAYKTYMGNWCGPLTYKNPNGRYLFTTAGTTPTSNKYLILNGYGQTYKRMQVDSVLHIPILDTLDYTQVTKEGQVVVNPNDGDFYWKYGGAWHSAMSQLSAALPGVLNFVDTVYINDTQDSLIFSVNGRRHAVESNNGKRAFVDVAFDPTSKQLTFIRQDGSDTSITVEAPNFVNTNLRATTNRTHSFSGNNLTIDSVRKFTLTTDSLLFKGLPSTSDTTLRPLLVDANGKTSKGSWPTGGGLKNVNVLTNTDTTTHTIVFDLADGSTVARSWPDKGSSGGGAADGNNFTSNVTYSNDDLATVRSGTSTIHTTLPFSSKANVSDTSSMLAPYLRKSDTTAMLGPYLRSVNSLKDDFLRKRYNLLDSSGGHVTLNITPDSTTQFHLSGSNDDDGNSATISGKRDSLLLGFKSEDFESNISLRNNDGVDTLNYIRLKTPHVIIENLAVLSDTTDVKPMGITRNGKVKQVGAWPIDISKSFKANTYFDDGHSGTFPATPKRVDDVIYNLIDDNTGEPVTFSKVTGVTDADIDSVILRKKGSEYFKLNFSGPLSIKKWAKGDGIADDTEPIRKALSNKYVKSFDFSDGIYKVGLTEGTTLGTFTNDSNINIIGNNAVIKDTTSYSYQGTFTPMFLFDNCYNVNISGVNYEGKLLSSPSTTLGYQGGIFVRAVNKTQKVSVNATVTNARYGVQSGEYDDPTKGNCRDFDVNLITHFCGYPVATYLASNITANITAYDVHRGAYFAGADNVRADVRFKNIYIANSALLITDAKTGSGTSKGASHVNVNVYDMGSTVFNPAHCAEISMSRVDPNTIFSDINVHFNVVANDTTASTIGGFLLSSAATDEQPSYLYNWDTSIIIRNLKISGVIDRTNQTIAGNPVGDIYISTLDDATHYAKLSNISIDDVTIIPSSSNTRANYFLLPGLQDAITFKNYVAPNVASIMQTNANANIVLSNSRMKGITTEGASGRVTNVNSQIDTTVSYLQTSNFQSLPAGVKLDQLKEDSVVMAVVETDGFVNTRPLNLSLFNNDAGFLAAETDPTVPTYAKTLTSANVILTDLLPIDGNGSGLNAEYLGEGGNTVGLKRTAFGGVYDANTKEDVIISNYEWSNVPYNSIGILETNLYSTDWVFQKFTDRFNNWWKRSFTSGTTWSDWEKMATENFVSSNVHDTANVLRALIPSAYTLPIASASVLGGVKVGSRLSIDVDGVLSASAYTASNGLTLSSSDFKLGGTLNTNTNINGASSYSLTATNLTKASFNVGSGFNTAFFESGIQAGEYYSNVTAVNSSVTTQISMGIGNAIHLIAPQNLLFIDNIGEFADNAAATSAGVAPGAIYRTGDTLKIVH